MMNRFLRWLVLPALAIALTGTAQAGNRSQLRVVSLGWGTWTPQGVTGFSDTTYLTGATQTNDTTASISTSDWDWTPIQSTDLNGLVNPVFKISVSSVNGAGFVSVDSFGVIVQGSPDNSNWTPLFSGTATVTGVPTTYGNQQVLSSVPQFDVITGGDAGGGVTPFPFYRFIVVPDGNTAARMSGTRCFISYYRLPDDEPHLVWKRLPWMVSGQDGSTTNVPVFKDTSSLTFSGPDTTKRIETTDWATNGSGLGPFAAADSTGWASRFIFQWPVTTTTEDSIYVYTDGSMDGITWSNYTGTTATPLIGTFGNSSGWWPCSSITTGAGIASGLAGNFPSVAGRYYTASPFGTPWLRFRCYGENSGEVSGGARVWIGYWLVPNKGS